MRIKELTIKCCQKHSNVEQLVVGSLLVDSSGPRIVIERSSDLDSTFRHKTKASRHSTRTALEKMVCKLQASHIYTHLYYYTSIFLTWSSQQSTELRHNLPRIIFAMSKPFSCIHPGILTQQTSQRCPAAFTSFAHEKSHAAKWPSSMNLPWLHRGAERTLGVWAPSDCILLAGQLLM